MKSALRGFIRSPGFSSFAHGSDGRVRDVTGYKTGAFRTGYERSHSRSHSRHFACSFGPNSLRGFSVTSTSLEPQSGQ